MKYNLFINQVKSLEWGLNAQQAMLFALVYDAQSWADSLAYDGAVFYNLSKGKICSELPLLTDKPDTAYRLMRQLEQAGLIELRTIRKCLFFHLTAKARLWNNSENISEKASETKSEKYPSDGKISEISRKNIRVKSENFPRNNIYQDNIHQDNTFSGCHRNSESVGNQANPSAPVEHSDSSRQKNSRGTRLPPDWQLPPEYAEDLRQIDSRLIPAARQIADKFRDYWVAVPGAKGVKLDWRATWRNWVRREAERLPGSPGSVQQLAGRPQFLTAAEKRAARNAEIFDYEKAMNF